MNRYLSIFIAVVMLIFFASAVQAQSNEKPKVVKDVGAVTGSEVQCSNSSSGGCPPMQAYGSTEPKRLHVAFGLGGSYFVKKAGAKTTGNAGAYLGVDYRPWKVLSVGADAFYGWLFGQGNQYLSGFNPGIKIFPMAYSDPKFEPFITLGAHAIELAWGDNSFRNHLMAQGGFAGVGFRWMPPEAILGMQAMVRASFLYRDKPSPQTGRGFALPIFAMIGVVY